MYTSQFAQDDADAIRALIESAPFATLLSTSGDRVLATPLPLIPDHAGRLLGHVALANPHAALLAEGAITQVLFHGPHCYISPSWYAKPSVPTWNYAMVEIEARVEVLRDEAAQQMLDALSARFENPDEAGDTPAMTPAARAPMLRAIHCCALHPLKTQASFKLSQNKTSAEQQQIISRLAQREDENSQAIASFMLRELATGFGKRVD